MPQSLQKKGVLHILRFSVLYSILIASVLILISFKSLQAEKEKQIEDRIESFVNSYEGGLLSKNLPLIIQGLQQRTSLQEILIYDIKCNLLAGSVLIIKNVCLQNKYFKSLDVNLAQTRFKLFYNYNFSFQDHLKEVSQTSLYWICGIFLITALVLYTFLYFTVLNPLMEIGKTIDNSQTSTLPEELSFFTSKIVELKNEILKAEADRTYIKTSKKVIHDIRNPLLYLRKLIEDGKFSCDELLGKLNDVDFQISSILDRSGTSVHDIALQTFFSVLKEDCLVMFNLKLEVSKTTQSSAVISLDPRHLKNIFLNFARNSYEAKSSQLMVSWKISEDFLEIHLEDNGIGIDPKLKEVVLKKQISTKSTGNGIGLSSAKEKLNAVGGDLLLCDSTCGAAFVLRIPLFKPGPEIALIDDDKFIHASWISKSEGKCLVHAFFSVDKFLKAKLSPNILVFIDSDLGCENPGELESKKIFAAGYENIYLSTGFCDIRITEYPWIKSLVPKSGPFTRIT